MAETLTYDAGTDTVTTSENLTPEEQDSLKVGQAMIDQQESLLAGKYKDAADLEKAYIELEKKLGAPKEEAAVEPDTEATTDTQETEKETEEVSPSVSLITDASTEYAEKGELSKETLAKFSELSSSDLVNAYIEMQSNAPEQTPSRELTDSDVNVIRNSVGGEQAYSNLVDWAAKNLPQNSQKAFDNLVTSGDLDAIQLAIQGIKAQYDDVNGYEGRMLSGKPSQQPSDVFKSQADLVRAMSDPRYDNDPAYRQDVIDKLDRSDIQF